MSDEWAQVAHIDDINTDTGLHRVEAFGKPVCLYLIDGAVHATQDYCTHGKACLSEGWLEDGTIECPKHQGVFDILTGEPVSPPVTVPIKVYDTRLEDGVIFVKPKE